MKSLAQVLFLSGIFVLATHPGRAQRPPAQKSTLTEWDAFKRRLEDHDGRTALSEGEVRHLLLAAGIPDNYPQDFIQSIDPNSLPGAVLLVTRDVGSHCVKVGVYSPKPPWRRQFKELWSAGESPAGLRFCSPTGCPMPGAFAVRNDGKPLQRGMEADAIVVYVPTKVLETGALCDSNLEVKYARNHKTYKPVQERTAPVRCGLADYYLAVDLAVRKAAGPAETIVSIDTLPIRGLRSPVVIQNEKGTFHAYSLTFPDDPSGYGSISFDREGLTPSQCVAMAESAPVNRTEVPIPQEKLKEFVDHLEKIDLRSDHCTRYKNGKCALFLDGMYYRVQVGSNDPIALFEFGNYRVRSENPALYAWTKSLLEEVATDLNTQQ